MPGGVLAGSSSALIGVVGRVSWVLCREILLISDFWGSFSYFLFCVFLPWLSYTQSPGLIDTVWFTIMTSSHSIFSNCLPNVYVYTYILLSLSSLVSETAFLQRAVVNCRDTYLITTENKWLSHARSWMKCLQFSLQGSGNCETKPGTTHFKS